MLNFREYLEKIEEYAGAGNIPGAYDGPGGMAYVPSHVSGTETERTPLASLDGVVKNYANNLDIKQSMRGIDLSQIPLITKTARVMFIKKEDNPIYAHLSDGARLYFTRGEYERANKPQIGQNIQYTMQRRRDDKSITPSQIHSIKTV